MLKPMNIGPIALLSWSVGLVGFKVSSPPKLPEFGFEAMPMSRLGYLEGMPA